MSERGICADGEAIFAVMDNGRSKIRWQLVATSFADAESEVQRINTLGYDFLWFEVKQVSETTR